MAEENEVIGTCPFHSTHIYRQQQLEDRVKELDKCFNDLKRDLGEIKMKQALISQQIKNLLWPVLIVLGAVLVEIGRTLLDLMRNGV